jgi:CMP-N-acetylneuraminic acid synthetase
MKIFIIIKHNSKRVKGKNFIKFSGVELYKKMLYKFNDYDVYVDTDSKEIYDECRRDKKLNNVTCYMRSERYIAMEEEGNLSPAPLLIKDFLEKYVDDDNELIVTTHVTSPFITMKTILDGCSKINEGYTSVASVVKEKTFSYLKTSDAYRPINFNPEVIQKTQDLNAIFHLVGAFIVITKGEFTTNGCRRISDNTYFYPLLFPESIDIDTHDDLDLALQVEQRWFV